MILDINHITPELNHSAQRCLTRFFSGDFSSITVNFVNVWLRMMTIILLDFQDFTEMLQMVRV
jgi:predicted signal transduction protein with EAL and GGDEF domain